MNRRGFTLVEMLIVIVVSALMMVLAFPRVKQAMEATSVRAARVTLANDVAKSRATAVVRGCRAVFHVVGGSSGRAWITTCRVGNVGAVAGASDTIGAVDAVSGRYGVDITTNVDSIRFDSRGIRMDYVLSTIVVTGRVYSKVDSLQIDQVGKVVQR